jgi:hypothetical protein
MAWTFKDYLKELIVPFGVAVLTAFGTLYLPKILPGFPRSEVGCIQGDCQNGIGTYYYGNGSYYTGYFSDGKRDGIGFLKLSNGKVLYGEFEENKFISKESGK